MKYEMGNKYCDTCCCQAEMKQCSAMMMEGHLPLCWEETFEQIEIEEDYGEEENQSIK